MNGCRPSHLADTGCIYVVKLFTLCCVQGWHALSVRSFEPAFTGMRFDAAVLQVTDAKSCGAVAALPRRIQLS